jgi:hypothetical protein
VAWFLAALLLFSRGWAAGRARRPADPEDARPLTRRDLVRAGAVIAVASFVVRLAWPFLATGAVLGLNLWEYPQMTTMFVLGALAAERGWLDDGLPAELRRACGRAAAVGVAAVAVIAVGVTLSDDPDPFLGGLRAEATLIPVVEAAIAIGATFWAIDWFRRRWDHAGSIAAGAAEASFAAYLVHAPVTDTFAMALRAVGVPAEVKLVAVLVLAVVASFGLGWLVTRSRVAHRIL